MKLLSLIARSAGAFLSRRIHGISGLTSVGCWAAVEYLIQRWHWSVPGSVFRIHPRATMHPLFGRAGSSDIHAFAQIFIHREYGCLDDLKDVRLVVDCGANIGYSSAYFLSRHPNSRLIAVEPDPENFAMLRRNLAPYGSRVNLIHAGVWSHSTRLTLVESRYRDGREWTKQVRISQPGDKADIEGVAIETLLASSGQKQISILKIDVEGAEAVIFSENCGSWLEKVDTIAIELHDDSVFGKASEVFFTAIEDRNFHVSRSGELTVCRKRTIL